MRLVRVAKALGMTGQELRHELDNVNFGVKPTDREVPDNLAQGILRFVAQKKGIEVDMESLGLAGFDDEEKKQGESEEANENSNEADEGGAQSGQENVGEQEGGEKKVQGVKKESLHVLRKLTLEDVSKEAIEEQQKSDPALLKKEKEEERIAEKAGAESKKRTQASKSHQQQIKRKEGVVLIHSEVTVKEFAEKAGVQVPKIIQVLMSNGIMATINQTIDFDTASIVASELGVVVQKEQEVATVEDLMSKNLKELLKDEPENLVQRPPVVVVMGHVDHGKTSILDAIRKTEVASGEAGGITQHIGAYQVEHTPEGSKEAHKITFLDTPGHEAFTAMRARGAQVTDIAVIVVAAEEGIKPTTVEAINHAKEAGVPILVAINKMDREGADPDRVKGELAQHDLQPEEWGGKTPVVLCSAKTNMGIMDLLDSIVLIAEIGEFKANPNRSAVATVIESHLDPSLGALATVIINTGTLKNGDIFVCGKSSGKVRTMMDAHGKRLDEVLPSGAVRISGYTDVPHVGDILQVVTSEQQAKTLVQAVKEQRNLRKKGSFVDLVTRLSEGKLTQLKVVLKADAQGSLEAIKEALSKKKVENVSVKVIHGAVGAVSESDVMMAGASEGVVIAFNVSIPSSVMKTAEREDVRIREYDVVYALLDDVEALIKGLVVPEEEENVLGHIEIRAIFMTKKSEQIVGGKVTDGVIKRLPFRIIREGQEVGTGRITFLKHGDKDIKEAKEGTECGMKVETPITVEEGDVLEIFLKELKKKE
ncbi:translation initiation factor IF-2 [Patescibacteria group bacterium]|nr:translation initiation factor IF-2 [Patescibacteria group bacterium]MBU1124135.1 translation initiation factor IF-2 [Patescibacteria group bacterium]MBU1911879.1 translation initiation factor IF-2 [Patescibacteria group bacterium]